MTTESLVICIHKANAVDAMSPSYTLQVGKGETLTSTVVRLLECPGIDHYDACFLFGQRLRTQISNSRA